jgi:hypothetical protein
MNTTKIYLKPFGTFKQPGTVILLTLGAEMKRELKLVKYRYGYLKFRLFIFVTPLEILGEIKYEPVIYSFFDPVLYCTDAHLDIGTYLLDPNRSIYVQVSYRIAKVALESTQLSILDT